MSKIKIEIEARQALEYARMIKCLEEWGGINSQCFKAMFYDLSDKFEKAFMKMPIDDYNELFQEKNK